MRPISNDELVQLGRQANTIQRDQGYKRGRIGILVNGVWTLPQSEKGKRFVTVTLVNEGTLLSGVDAQGISTPGAEVRLVFVSGKWVVDGPDAQSAIPSAAGGSVTLPEHNHNIGFPLFYPVDPASINDGIVSPTGNGLEVKCGRVTYPKSDGALGIYDSDTVLDLAGSPSGLTATQERWVVIYILRTDGSVNFHSAAATTAPANVTTDIEDAVADCLSSVPDAYPYHVVRVRAGLSVFSSYVGAAGRDVSNKRFVRLGNISGSGTGSSSGRYNILRNTGNVIPSGETAFFAGELTIQDAADLEIEDGAGMVILT